MFSPTKRQILSKIKNFVEKEHEKLAKFLKQKPVIRALSRGALIPSWGLHMTEPSCHHEGSAWWSPHYIMRALAILNLISRQKQDYADSLRRLLGKWRPSLSKYFVCKHVSTQRLRSRFVHTMKVDFQVKIKRLWEKAAMNGPEEMEHSF